VVKSLILGMAVLAGVAGVANADPSRYAESYAGTMTQLVTGGMLGYSAAPCEYSRPVKMTIEGANVGISYLYWGKNAIHYRGALNLAGGVVAWHTNGDGSRSILTGQIGAAGFDGYMERDHQACSYKVTMQPAGPHTPGR
jgi:hypothetical protein